MFRIAALMLVLSAAPALAEDVPTFTTEDARLMVSCLDGSTVGEGENATDCVGVASRACMETEPDGATTVGMVACTARETAWWDSQLNAHYSSLEASLSADLATALREAQRAWIAYRDAGCGFEYDLWSEGTIRSVVHAGCLLDETARRAQRLAGYVDGEGAP